MYKVTDVIPEMFDISRGGDPVICLVDEFGGQSVIVIDDHCFMLLNGSKNCEFKSTYHWFKEAVLALSDFQPLKI